MTCKMGVSGAKEVKFTTFAGRKNLIELKLIDGVPANISVGGHFYSIFVIFVANRKIVAIFESVLELKEKKGVWRVCQKTKSIMDNA